MILQVTGTKHLQEYIKIRQATVTEWVALRPIFKVCAKYTGNLTNNQTYVKTVDTNEPNQDGYPNAPNMTVLNENDIIDRTLLIPP